jgi:hypothetical protein
MIWPSRQFASVVAIVRLSWVHQRRMAMPFLAAAAWTAAALSADASLALAKTTTPTPGVIPPEASVQGRTYAQWSAAQWKWEFAQPNVPTSPVVDPNPGSASNPEHVDCALGQSGTVWFLAGTTVVQPSSPTYRTCNVPAGKFLFFPVIDSWIDNLNCPGQPSGILTASQLKQTVLQQTSSIVPGSMSVKIDRRTVAGLQDSSTAYRAAADGFFYKLPGNNWLSRAFCPGNPFPAGTMPPPPGAFADGVYIMLAPLSVGVHHLSFAAIENGASESVTYTITVTP